MIPSEAIERVIDDLETKVQKLDTVKYSDKINGIVYAYLYAIVELRKVVEDYGASKS